MPFLFPLAVNLSLEVRRSLVALQDFKSTETGYAWLVGKLHQPLFYEGLEGIVAKFLLHQISLDFTCFGSLMGTRQKRQLCPDTIRLTVS